MNFSSDDDDIDDGIGDFELLNPFGHKFDAKHSAFIESSADKMDWGEFDDGIEPEPEYDEVEDATVQPMLMTHKSASRNDRKAHRRNSTDSEIAKARQYSGNEKARQYGEPPKAYCPGLDKQWCAIIIAGLILLGGGVLVHWHINLLNMFPKMLNDGGVPDPGIMLRGEFWLEGELSSRDWFLNPDLQTALVNSLAGISQCSANAVHIGAVRSSNLGTDGKAPHGRHLRTSPADGDRRRLAEAALGDPPSAEEALAALAATEEADDDDDDDAAAAAEAGLDSPSSAAAALPAPPSAPELKPDGRVPSTRLSVPFAIVVSQCPHTMEQVPDMLEGLQAGRGAKLFDAFELSLSQLANDQAIELVQLGVQKVVVHVNVMNAQSTQPPSGL